MQNLLSGLLKLLACLIDLIPSLLVLLLLKYLLLQSNLLLNLALLFGGSCLLPHTYKLPLIVG